MDDLEKVLEGSHKPYRKLVEHHLRRQSTARILLAAQGEVELLPDVTQRRVSEFIDAVNERIGYDQRFWRNADIKTAFGFIIQEAIKELEIDPWIRSESDAYLPENHELALNIFQIATLNMAHSASMSPKQRKFMGIKKDSFFR